MSLGSGAFNSPQAQELYHWSPSGLRNASFLGPHKSEIPVKGPATPRWYSSEAKAAATQGLLRGEYCPELPAFVPCPVTSPQTCSGINPEKAFPCLPTISICKGQKQSVIGRNRTKHQYGGAHLQPQHTGGKGRQISVNSRPVWSMQ